MAYIGSSPTKVVSRQSANIFTYTATANQTAFTGADANGNTLACTPSDIMVHMNGLRLEESDYTASTTTVTLGSGAAAGDEVTITAFLTFESADHYTKSAADTRYVNATGDTMSGDLSVTGGDVTITGSSNTDATLNVLSPSWASGAYADINIGYQPTSRKIRGHYDNGIEVFTNNTFAALKVHPTGSVTMPYQPAFRAYLTSNTDITTQQPLVYQAVLYNRGSHYNTSNGRFTAPVTGVYHFGTFHWHRVSTAGQVIVYFYVNGSLNAEFRHSRNGATGYYDRVGFNHDILLNANDYVTVDASGAGGGNLHTSSNFNNSYFAGHLVG